MAAITFNAAHQKVHIREQLKTVLAAFREMLDVFVSNRMRRAVAEAEHIRPRRPQGTQSQSINAQ
jgi:vancomycin permeability regulator SanA